MPKDSPQIRYLVDRKNKGCKLIQKHQPCWASICPGLVKDAQNLDAYGTAFWTNQEHLSASMLCQAHFRSQIRVCDRAEGHVSANCKENDNDGNVTQIAKPLLLAYAAGAA